MADRIGVISKGEIILVEEKNTLMRKLAMQLDPFQTQFLRYLAALGVMLPLMARGGWAAWRPKTPSKRGCSRSTRSKEAGRARSFTEAGTGAGGDRDHRCPGQGGPGDLVPRPGQRRAQLALGLFDESERLTAMRSSLVMARTA